MNKSIILGVTGSIAAYKSADIVSGLVRTEHNVNVVMTSSAAKFVTPLTLETLSKNKVHVDMFEDEGHSLVTHIALATESDLILIAPVTYDIIENIKKLSDRGYTFIEPEEGILACGVSGKSR